MIEISEPPSGRSLQKRRKQIHDNCPDDFNVRIRRALSWMQRAEKEQQLEDDIRFIMLWIGLNALYESYVPEDKHSKYKEFKVVNEFLTKLLSLDQDGEIHRALWDNPKVKNKVLQLVKNKFVCREFWQSFHERGTTRNWISDVESQISEDIKAVREAFQQRKTGLKHLRIVFRRLYTLRNQMVHGSTTVKTVHGGTQRNQGNTVLAALLPVFISIMLNHPNEDWGKLSYPSKDNADFARSM